MWGSKVRAGAGVMIAAFAMNAYLMTADGEAHAAGGGSWQVVKQVTGGSFAEFTAISETPCVLLTFAQSNQSRE